MVASNSQQIRLWGDSLQLGESTREICPSCGGGSTEEKSLSITLREDGTLVWNCFRANCTGTGGSAGGMVGSTGEPLPAVQQEREVNTRRLNAEEKRVICQRWGICSVPEHWYFDTISGRLAMSVRGPKYTHRGWVLRDMTGQASCKTLNVMKPNEETLSWYKKSLDVPTVLVEDLPSAVRASRYINAIALMGTHCGLSRALEISTYGTRPLMIALDQDATNISFALYETYGLMWDNPTILPLKRDMKDMKEDELCTLLQEY